MSSAVSIILPTYNRLEFLRPAIESVFAQTFDDWELVIADDGSSGDTRTYLETLEDSPRVKVIWLRHTGRPSVVRNAALREAHGEYVAFLDSDDVWLPRKLEIQIASLRCHATRRWSYTKFALVDPAGNPTAWQRTRSWPVPDGWILDKLVKSETVIAMPSVIASRALLEQGQGFGERLVMCEEYDMWLRLAAQSEVDAIHEALTLVTRHAKHSGNEIISFQDCVRVFEKVMRARGTEHLHPILREKRAEAAAGLARSHASYGDRGAALRTLLSSVRFCWRYPLWWFGALQATARACAPQAVRRAARRYRNGLP